MIEARRTTRAKEGIVRAVDGIGTMARSGATQLVQQAGDLRDAAAGTIEKVTARAGDPYETAIVEYNGAFTAMNDKGHSLLRQRERSTDLIDMVELLVNSLTNTPKAFATDFDEVKIHRAEFLEGEEFARRDLDDARRSAVGAGAGLTAGVAVAGVAPTAAIWVATTFGTASTGTAISTLSGAAATNAALAWLGGGALTAGGGGTAAGSALLALAGPIGWTVAGATLLASIALFARKKSESREAKQKALIALKRNTALVDDADARIDDLLRRTVLLRELLVKSYREALSMHGADFASLSIAEQSRIVALVNATHACAALLSRRIEQEDADG